jgi:hypothetical protein
MPGLRAVPHLIDTVSLIRATTAEAAQAAHRKRLGPVAWCWLLTLAIWSVEKVGAPDLAAIIVGLRRRLIDAGNVLIEALYAALILEQPLDRRDILGWITLRGRTYPFQPRIILQRR